MIARSVFYTGNIEQAKRYTSLACSMFDLFISRATGRGLSFFVETRQLDKFAWARFVLNGNIGSVHIHADFVEIQKKKIIEMTIEVTRCAWNIKPLKKTSPPSPLHPDGTFIMTPGSYFFFNGSGYGQFCLDNRRVVPSFGGPYYELALPFVPDYDFFDDAGWSTSAFLPDGFYNISDRLHGVWGVCSSRLIAAASTLASNYIYGSWYYRPGYYAKIIDQTVPAKDGIKRYGSTDFDVTFFSLISSSSFSIIRKSSSQIVAHAGGDLQTQDDGDYYEISVTPGNYVHDISEFPFTQSTTGRFFCDEAFYSPSASASVLDSGFVSVSVSGETERASLIREIHIDIPPYEDWYFFSTRNNGEAEITQIEKDGSVTQNTIKIVDNVIFNESPDSDTWFRLVAIPGYDVRENGGYAGAAFHMMNIVSPCRNIVVFTNLNGRPHEDLTYNFAINTGAGFVGANLDSTLHMGTIFGTSEDSFVGIHTIDLTFRIVKFSETSPGQWGLFVIEEFAPAEITYNGSIRKTPMRLYRTPDYSYFVVYGSDGKDGVYSISDIYASKIGEATGLWPVLMSPNNDYVLMENAAYGSISGTFNKLVGFFYDKEHWLECVTDAVSGKMRFEIKNTEDGIVKATEFGEYSFYETDPSVTFACICHCSEDGISKSDDTGKSTLVVNFLDGPFDFETMCAAIVYDFKAASTPIDVGLQRAKLGSEFFYGGKTYPPYGRKYITTCTCNRIYDENWNLYPGGLAKTCIHVSNLAGSTAFYDKVICPHSNGGVQELVYHEVSRVAVAQVNTDPWQKRVDDTPISRQLIYAIAHNGLYRVFERITDEPGDIDPLLLHEPERVTDSVEISEV